MVSKKRIPTKTGRLTAMENALKALIREQYLESFGPVLSDSVRLNLSFHIDSDWNCHIDPPLDQQIQPQLETILADYQAFQEGSIYCFRCQSSHCDHSRPPTGLEVFRCYDELGCPKWCDFSQLLLDLGDERVNALFEEPPRVISLVQSGNELQTRRLASFGKSSKTYSIIQQVAAGYIKIQNRESPYQEKIAMTFQAVETRDSRGTICFRLNTLIGTKDQDLLDQLKIGEQHPWLFSCIRKANKALETLNPGLKSEKPGMIQQVSSKASAIMKRLAADLMQGHRQSKQRTQHAQLRRDIRRPISSAMEDLRTAPAERCFFDKKTEAIAILGHSGRCHIFNQEGKHITSFHMTGDEVQWRLHKKRWSPLQTELHSNLLENIENPQ